MSAALLKLERFDAPALTGPGEHDVRTQQARAEAYAEGYAAGAAAASAKAGEHEKLIAAVAALVEAEALAAPAHVQAQAVAAIRVVIEAMFPALSRAGFAAEAASALAALIKDAPAAALTISTAPEHAESLEALIKELAPAATISVSEDPAITGPVARAEWNGGGVEFDLERAAAECLAALENAIGNSSNGKSS